jgi:hypothetical protein
MQNDNAMFDWTSELGSRAPTWLEVIASHARLLAASEDDTGLYQVRELRQLFAGADGE